METGWDIWILSREGGTEPFLHTPFNERYPEFSPDGRWLLYTSDESGREEVYVRPYPEPGRTVQISTNGGDQPAWSRDGREVLYRKLGEVDPRLTTFFAVQVDVVGDHLTPRRPQVLFDGDYGAGGPIRSYDVAPDGRFLLTKEPDDSANVAIIDQVFPTRIRIVQNWFAELEEMLSSSE
jgi:hypothetical protein